MTSASVGASLASALQQSSLLRAQFDRTPQGANAAKPDQAQQAALKVAAETGSQTNADGTPVLVAPSSRKEGERSDLTSATQQAPASADLVGYPSYNSFGRYKGPRPSAGTVLNVAA